MMRRVAVKWKVLELQAARPTDMHIGRSGSPNLQKENNNNQTYKSRPTKARTELGDGIVEQNGSRPQTTVLQIRRCGTSRRVAC